MKIYHYYDFPSGYTPDLGIRRGFAANLESGEWIAHIIYRADEVFVSGHWTPENRDMQYMEYIGNDLSEVDQYWKDWQTWPKFEAVLRAALETAAQPQT